MASQDDTANVIAPSPGDSAGDSQSATRESLDDLGWPELLRRFSEAAFKVHAEEYEEMEDPPEKPSDILLPPIAAKKLAEVEYNLGTLPPDLKEMVLVANGFKGGAHFAGGGFAGIDKFEKEPAGDHEIYLGVEPVHTETQTTRTDPDGTTRVVTVRQISIPGSETGINWGPVWVGNGTVENDGFYHIICPPKTWKKIKGGDVKPGEYRVLNYAHWTAGPHDEGSSMRDWIVTMTKELESELKSQKIT
jgi:hypothetical protein